MNRVETLEQPVVRSRVTCAHCGLPVPAHLIREGEGNQFCCGGCAQVWDILHAAGMEGFYRVREMEGAAGVPAAVNGRAFEDFDDPIFQERYVRPNSGGACETELYLEGVHCAACAWLVERLPQTHPGLVGVRLDLGRSRAHVQWDPAVTRLSAVARRLDRIGYTPHPYREADLAGARRAEDRSFLLRVGVAAAGSMNIMFLQIPLYAASWNWMDPGHERLLQWASLALATPVVAWAGFPFVRTAWQGLTQRVLHIDLPIAIAIWAAFLASAWHTIRGAGEIWFDSVTMLVALLLAGRWVQQRAQRRALETAERLHGGTLLDHAWRLSPDGSAQEVPLEALRPGERIRVRSGEVIPVDGVVLAGTSAVDQAALTGESVPQPVGPGEAVSAHTVNLGAAIEVEVRATGLDTRVGGLLALVDEARRRAAPLVSLTDRIGRVFVAVVLVLAAASGVWWWSTGQSLEHVVALLVVSCPCALGLATPLAMTTALTQAARRGIYVKGADVVQVLARVREVVFDKTGTLTEGRVRLVRWEGEEDVLALAVALARQSTHPIARALAEGRPGAGATATRCREVAGRGMEGYVDGRSVALGNLAWMADLGIPVDATRQARVEDTARDAHSPILVAVDGRPVALGAFGDPLRPEAEAVLGHLQRAGWRVRILSGDHPQVVAAVCVRLGLSPDAGVGGLSPEDKHRRVEEAVAGARARGVAVLMVGDGVNDAAALAVADVGVSMAGGSGASVQAADVVLTRPGLQALVDLERGSHRVITTIWRNLAFSLFYNVIGVCLALLGLVGPLLAAVLMPLSSLTVISSSVLARTFAPGGR